MDAACKIQRGIHLFDLVYNMCPELWVHISLKTAFFKKSNQILLDFCLNDSKCSNHYSVSCQFNDKRQEL